MRSERHIARAQFKADINQNGTRLRKVGYFLTCFGELLGYIDIGRSYHYPWCCCLHYGIDVVYRQLPPAKRRGSCKNRSNKNPDPCSIFVPCHLHRILRWRDWAPWGSSKRQRQLTLF